MAWTYGGTPTVGTRDEIRFLIGDTDITNQLLQDGEIDYFMGRGGSAEAISANCCDSVSARFSGKADMTVGSISLTFSGQANRYREMAAEYRGRASQEVMPYCGGISISDKETMQANTDIPPTALRRGLMSNVGNSSCT